MEKCNILQTVFIVIAIIGLCLCFTGNKLSIVGATMITVVLAVYGSIFVCMKKNILDKKTLRIIK